MTGVYPHIIIRSDDLKKEILSNTRRSQTPVLGGTLWREKDGAYEFMPVKLGGIQLWAPQIRVTGRKTIVETQLVERGGSVKEIISTDDYVVNIRGVIKNTDGLWPDLELNELLELYRRNEAVPIESALTASVFNGNEYVVITNLSLPGNPGFVESIRYEIECVSDTPFTLELNENGNEGT